jgi:hypothetical protein
MKWPTVEFHYDGGPFHRGVKIRNNAVEFNVAGSFPNAFSAQRKLSLPS